jgi:hypothetical protein
LVAVKAMHIFALQLRENTHQKRFSQVLNNDSVAQLVEQYTFNVWVLGSSPNGITSKNESLAKAGLFYFVRLSY